MGGREDEEGHNEEEEQLHTVQITKPYYLGMFQVTQGEYIAVMQENPSVFHGKNRPVEHVSWKQAVEFCTWGASPPMLGGCMTCTAMCGNGAKITGMAATTLASGKRRATAIHGSMPMNRDWEVRRGREEMSDCVCCVAVPGPAARCAAARPTATTSAPPMPTTPSAFVCVACPEDVFLPPLSPPALSPGVVSSLGCWRRRRRDFFPRSPALSLLAEAQMFVIFVANDQFGS